MSEQFDRGTSIEKLYYLLDQSKNMPLKILKDPAVDINN